MKTNPYGEPEIVDWIVASRSILLQGRTVPHMEEGLQRALALVPEVEILGSRRILGYCIERALKDVRAGRLASAGWILNLVHNLPVHAGSRNWDIDFFLKGWLPSFLDHYDEIEDARDIILHVCREVADSPELRQGKWG